MRMLAIETASEACSIALFEGGALIASDNRLIGRGHAEALVPMIGALPDKGRADRILVSLGPGSFTGVRIGLATARALGFAWEAEVLGYPTLALVAVRAWQPTQCPVTVCMNGGHGEWFLQNYIGDQPQGDFGSFTPDAASKTEVNDVIIGNRAQQLADLFDTEKRVLDLLPDAAKANLLHEARLIPALAPIYGRAPDATPQAGWTP